MVEETHLPSPIDHELLPENDLQILLSRGRAGKRPHRGYFMDFPSLLHRICLAGLIVLGLIFIGLTIVQIWIGFGQGFPRNQHHMPAQELYLYLHFAASLVVFLLLPLQVFRPLRSRMGYRHRYIGRVIVILMVPAAIGGISLATTIRLGIAGKIGFGLGGAFWLVSAYIAVHYARRRNWRLHQAWAEIFTAVTLGAIAIRLEYPLFRELGVDKDLSYTLAAWSAWFGNLAIVLIWQWRRGLWMYSSTGTRSHVARHGP